MSDFDVLRYDCIHVNTKFCFSNAMCNDAIFFMTRTLDLDALQRKEKSVKNLQN